MFSPLLNFTVGTVMKFREIGNTSIPDARKQMCRIRQKDLADAIGKIDGEIWQQLHGAKFVSYDAILRTFYRHKDFIGGGDKIEPVTDN